MRLIIAVFLLSIGVGVVAKQIPTAYLGTEAEKSCTIAENADTCDIRIDWTTQGTPQGCLYDQTGRWLVCGVAGSINIRVSEGYFTLHLYAIDPEHVEFPESVAVIVVKGVRETRCQDDFTPGGPRQFFQTCQK